MSTATDTDRRRAWWDLWVLLLPLLVAAIIGLVVAVDAAVGDETAAPAATPAAETTAPADEPVATEPPATTTEALPEPEPLTVADIVGGDDRLGALAGLLGDAGLVESLTGTGPFTVFAPTDAALADALDALGDAADDSDVVAQILAYHVVAGRVGAEDALAAESAETLQGEDLTFIAEGSAIVVNESVSIIDADLEADNGVVHVINGVLIPPSLRVPDTTVLDVIAADDRLGALAGALSGAGLDDVLTGDGPFTVFAPTDAALAAAITSLGEAAADPELLEAVLSYHVVPGSLDADAVAAESSLRTVQGEPIAIELDGTSVVVNGDTQIVEADLVAGNGVVHVIDTVLLPPSIGEALALTADLNELFGLEPIQFDTSSATIRAESQATLDRAADVLGGVARAAVDIRGHTDDEGDAGANQALSEARAQAVLDALVERGIDPGRLTATGFGETDPIADNTTPEGRQRNRRIEFRLP